MAGRPLQTSVAFGVAWLVAAGLGATPEAPSDRLFRHLTVHEGLSHNTVYAVAQDPQGYVWIGSEDGLDRYDGYEVRRFGASRSDPEFAVQDVSSLEAGPDGVLWVGTWGGGVRRFGPDRLAVDVLDHQLSGLSDDRVQAVHVAVDGTFWAGSYRGLNRLGPDGARFETVPPELADRRVWSLADGPDGGLWVATSQGLVQLDAAGRPVAAHRPDPGDPSTLVHDLVRTLFVDAAGDLWVGTEDGLDRLRAGAHTFEHFLSVPGDPTTLSSNTVNAIWQDAAGALWVGTQEGGLNRLEPAIGTIERLLNDPANPRSLAHDDVRDLAGGSDGLLWIATRGGGVDILDLRPAPFRHLAYRPRDPQRLSHRQVAAILESRPGDLWVGTLRGVTWRRGEVVKRFVQDPTDPTALVGNQVEALAEDERGAIWVGTRNGLSRVVWEGEEPVGFASYRSDQADPWSLPSDRVEALLTGPEGRLWVGTEGGLVSYEPEVDGFEPAAENLTDRFVTTLYESSDGLLWIGTDAGYIDRFDPATGEIESFGTAAPGGGPVRPGRVTAMAEDAEGSLWIGTRTALVSLDPTTGSRRLFTVRDGLPSSTIHCLALAGQALWVSSNGGLFRLDTGDFRVRAFDVAEGLQGLIFVDRACEEGPSGTFYFGGLNGLNSFDPRLVEPDPEPPPVRLSGWTVGSERVVPELGGLGERRLEIGPGSNRFAFEFTAFDYRSARRIRYAYRLDGLDGEWIPAGSQRLATYTSVEPGTYLFRVRAARDDGPWGAEDTTLVVVAAPVWDTWWFRGLAVLLVGLVGLGGHRYRLGQARRRQALLEREVELRTGELDASRQEVEQRNAQLSIINETVKLINAEIAFPDQLLAILEGVAFVERARWAIALVRTGGPDEFSLAAASGATEELPDLDPIARSEIEQLFLAGAEEVGDGIFLGETGERTLSGRFSEAASGLSTASALLVMTVVLDEEIVGYLVFATSHFEGSFVNEDPRTLENLRDHVASAFIKGRILDELERRRREVERKNAQLSIINDTVQLINAEIAFPDQLLAILEGVAFVERARWAIALVLSDRPGEFSLAAASGATDELPDLDPIDESEIERLFLVGSKEVGEGIFVGVADEDTLSGGLAKTAAVLTPPGALLVMTVELEGVVVGYLVFASTDLEGSFVDEEPKTLENLRNHVTSAFIKGRILAELERRRQEVERKNAHLSIIDDTVQLINAEIAFPDQLMAILEGVAFVERARWALALAQDRLSGRFSVAAATGVSGELPELSAADPEEVQAAWVEGAEEIGDGIFLAIRPSSPFRGSFGPLTEVLPDPDALLVMTVTVEEEPIGYLVFASSDAEGSFVSEDPATLENLRNHVTSAYIKGRMLDRLERLNEKKNEFLGIAAHDLRSPLSSVIGFAEVLLRRLEGDGIDKELGGRFLANIRRSAEHMRSLINGLLDVSAIESGRVSVELGRQQIGALVAERKEIHLGVAETKGIELRVVEGPVVEVLVDRTHIGEVLDNLLSNALKYTEQGGEIEVGWSVEGPEVVVRVTDSGLGLHPEELSHVFTGRRLSARPTGGESSTGLGLAIARKLVELHSGRIWVESEKGRGAVFSFSLPVAV